MSTIHAMNRYEFDGKGFSLRSRWISAVKYTLVALAAILALFYVDPPAEASYGSATNIKADREYWRCLDWISSHSKMKEAEAAAAARAVIKYSKEYGHRRNLLLALIQVESRFDPYAVSPVGALGLTQVMPYWHSDKARKLLGEKGTYNPFDIDSNVRMGAWILKEYGGDLQRYNGEKRNTVYTGLVLSAKKELDKQLPET